MRLASIEPSVWRPAATAFRERILSLVRGSVNAKGHLTQHDPVLDGNSNPGRLGGSTVHTAEPLQSAWVYRQAKR